jgi:hypothetical protein
VLAGTLAVHHPGSRLTVLVTGPKTAVGAGEPFEVLQPDELDVPGWHKLLAARRWADLEEFFKPHLLSRLIAEGASESIFLDAAVDVCAPLESVSRALERHGAVVAPRLMKELPVDGLRPYASDLCAAGRFGASLVAVGRRQVAVELVRWWAERLTRSARHAPVAAPHPDRSARVLNRWLDLAPSVFADLAVLDDPGSALSYWNAHERDVEQHAEAVTVDGRPLRFVHFEGFDPARPFLLHPHAERVRVSDNAALAALCESYAARLRDAGWRDHRRRADVGRPLPNGMIFDDRLSHLLAEAAAAGDDPGDVFSEEGAERFMGWLARPAAYGANSGINRYLYAVYEERDDLRRVYPDLDGSHGDAFARWSWVFGVHEMAIPERFLPPRPDGAGVTSSAREDTRAEPLPPLPRGPRPDLSMKVTGLLTGTLGLGEAARGYVNALGAAGIPVSTSTIDVRDFVELGDVPHEGYARIDYTDLDGASSAGFNLVCINADELPRLAESVGEGFFLERPTIGVWGWETDHVPERWKSAFGLLDEIWVYSNYVAENLGRAAPIPVRRIPPPVTPPDPGDVTLQLDIPDGFRFVFMFDFFSTIQRKNPVGLIEAFRSAFEPGAGPQLLIKTINGVHRPQALEEVLWAARGRPDVHVLDRSLSARERDALLAECDCYVSLHRSEGFGLTLAECMALGKPVIGTNYSATTDFITAENGYPVPYELTRVGADCEIYPAEGTWAEPDVAEAAQLMRTVVERPEEARAKGEVARRDIERLYAPAAVGAMIHARLEEISALWPSRGESPDRKPSGVARGSR